MGFSQRPSFRDYWIEDTLLETPGFKKIFSRDEFLLINRFFQIEESFPKDPSDPFKKMRNFAISIIKTSRLLYMPANILSLDESMINFRGRHVCKQYMPAKPIKFGFKLYVIAEAETGFMCSFLFHGSKEYNEILSESENNSSIENVVLSLTDGLENNGYHIFMDRYYTSCSLFVKLKDKGIRATGTILQNRRGLPKEIEISNQPNQYQFYFTESLNYCIWKDKKIVHFLSNFYNNIITFSERKDESGNKKLTQIPRLVNEYTQYMRGVDILDQNISYYMMQHRSIR